MATVSNGNILTVCSDTACVKFKFTKRGVNAAFVGFDHERLRSTGNKPCSLAYNVPLSFKICIAKCLSLIETLARNYGQNHCPRALKIPFPVDVRSSKTSLVRLSNAPV